MALPFSARPRIRRWISARAPTSTPRVGSSRMRTRGARCEPAADHHLLLVAAAEAGDRRVDALGLDRQRADRLEREVGAGARADQRKSRADHDALEVGEADIEGEALGEDQPFGAPLLRHEAESGLHRGMRASAARRAGRRATCVPLSGCVGAVDQADQFGPARRRRGRRGRAPRLREDRS